LPSSSWCSGLLSGSARDVPRRTGNTSPCSCAPAVRL
jgi:hypothetical protein